MSVRPCTTLVPFTAAMLTVGGAASRAAAQAPSPAPPGQAAQPVPRMTRAAARTIIAEGNRAWGRARVALDRATFDRMLAPDFYVQFPDRRMSRQEFMDEITGEDPRFKLARFDASVLTVEPRPDGSWSAVIQEKLEIEAAGADGKPERGYALWITRDGWRQTRGEWQITSSEVISFEQWRPGAPPPIPGWE